MRMIKWIVIKSLTALLVYAWAIEGHQWAENIMKLWIWILLIGNLLILTDTDTIQELRDKGRSVPKLIAGVYDLCLLLLIVGWGSVFYGALYMLYALVGRFILDGGKADQAMAVETHNTNQA